MLCTFDDHVTMVDSFGPKFFEPKNDPLLAVPEFMDGVNWVRAERERFRRTGPKEVALKYHKLQAYIDSRIDGDLSTKRGCLS